MEAPSKSDLTRLVPQSNPRVNKLRSVVSHSFPSSVWSAKAASDRDGSRPTRHPPRETHPRASPFRIAYAPGTNPATRTDGNRQRPRTCGMLSPPSKPTERGSTSASTRPMPFTHQTKDTPIRSPRRIRSGAPRPLPLTGDSRTGERRFTSDESDTNGTISAIHSLACSPPPSATAVERGAGGWCLRGRRRIRGHLLTTFSVGGARSRSARALLRIGPYSLSKTSGFFGAQGTSHPQIEHRICAIARSNSRPSAKVGTALRSEKHSGVGVVRSRRPP